jgi:hypothetical protein
MRREPDRQVGLPAVSVAFRLIIKIGLSPPGWSQGWT